MGLRARRHIVVWNSSRGLRPRHRIVTSSRPAGTRPLGRFLRVTGLVTAIGLIRLGKALRLRWRPLLPGVALTATGIALRGGPGGLAFLCGFLFLYAALIMHPSTAVDRKLKRELADYSTPAERRDLEAILDRYSDGDTSELRDILARQAMASHDTGVPGLGRLSSTRR
jgi:hypothetical protein